MSRHACLACVLTLLALGCPPGSALAQPDYVQDDHYYLATMVVALTSPLGWTEIITLSGECAIEVSFEGPQPGDANDDDGNQLDEVPARMYIASLCGDGELVERLDVWVAVPPGPNDGQIEERFDEVTGQLDLAPYAPRRTADIYLDNYFAIDPGGGIQYVHPYRVSGRLHRTPAYPGDVLTGQGTVPMLDVADAPTGWYFEVLSLRLEPMPQYELYEHAVMMLELAGPGGAEIIQLKGWVETSTLFEGDVLGDATDDDQDARDEVLGVVHGFSLRGVSAANGPIQLEHGYLYPSQGMLEESFDTVPGTLDLAPYGGAGDAAWLLNLYYKLTMGGQEFITFDPQRISGLLSQVPAAPSDGLSTTQPVMLYDEFLDPSPYTVRVDYLRLNPPLERDRFESVALDLRLYLPGGQEELVTLAGLATVETLFEGAVMGAASDDDRNSRDDVSTELTELDLFGTSSLGSIHLRSSTDPPSLGRIEELVNLTSWWLDLPPFTAGGSADSFFDVFVEVELAGQSFSTNSPERIEGLVTHKPAAPGDEMFGVNQVELFDENSQPTGFYILFQRLQLGPISTAVEPGSPPTRSSVILAAAPNPFNPSLRIRVQLDRPGPVSLRVFDTRGRLVTTLYEGELPATEHFFVWDGRDRDGRAVVSGIYHLQLKHAGDSATRKVTLVR